ncbi:hypothetical protein R3P38DRAFT_99042 [Favolaschia claudopus]|uniref:Uncharacterized protein n=1 Tax=Favolaschia claudopus TaxID=2862362 RepID=A0AAV9ZXM4_9AGAR
MNVANRLLTVIQELFVGCTLILRVLAMYSFDRRLVVILVMAAILCLSLAAWLAIPTKTALAATVKNVQSDCIPPATRPDLLREAGAWGALLAGDTFLLALTLHRAYTTRRKYPTGSLWRVLVRDGAMYFVVICLANVGNILMFNFGDVFTATCLSGFTVSLSVTMICRLMLNLHKAAETPSDILGSANTQTLQFAQPTMG